MNYIQLNPNPLINRSDSSGSDEYSTAEYARESESFIHSIRPETISSRSSMMAKDVSIPGDMLQHTVSDAVFVDSSWSITSVQPAVQHETVSHVTESSISEQTSVNISEQTSVNQVESVSVVVTTQDSTIISHSIPAVTEDGQHQSSYPNSISRAPPRPKRPRVQVPSDGASKSHASPRTVHTRGSPAVKQAELNPVPTGPIITPSFRALPLILVTSAENETTTAQSTDSHPISSISSPSSYSSLEVSHTNVDFATSQTDNSDAAMFYRHSWSLWQMRCDFLLSEVMRKVNKQIILARGQISTPVHVTSSKRRSRSKTNTAKAQSNTQYKSAAFAFPDMPERGTNVIKSNLAHEHPVSAYVDANATSLIESDSSSHIIPSQSADQTQHTLQEPNITLSDSDISTLAAESFSLENVEDIDRLIALIPPHHSLLTLPVIHAMLGICSLIVPPAPKHERLLAVSASCLQLPIPPAFHALDVHSWSSDHFFNYSVAPLSDWALPDERISVLYPYSTLPHHQSALDAYNTASNQSQQSGKGGKSKGGKRSSLKRQRSPSPSVDDLPPRHPPSSVSSIPSPHQPYRMLGGATPPDRSVTRTKRSKKETTQNDVVTSKSLVADSLGRIGGRKSKMTSDEKKALNEARAGLFDAKLRRVGLVLSQERSRRLLSGQSVPQSPSEPQSGQSVPQLSSEPQSLTARQALPSPLYEAVERECTKLNVSVARAWQELDWVARLIVTRGIQHLMPPAGFALPQAVRAVSSPVLAQPAPITPNSRYVVSTHNSQGSNSVFSLTNMQYNSVP